MFFWSKKNRIEGKIVMAFGTFDFLHAGHENYLKEAKKLGDHLIVVIGRDNTVRSIKGRPAANSEKNRLKNLRQTGWADRVILGNRGDKHQIVLKYRPAVIALGYDQFAFTQTLQKTLIDHNLNTEIVRLTPYFPQTYKSSQIRQIQENKTAGKTEKPTAIISSHAQTQIPT
jgi:cytidyltransferase-like protein